MNTLASVFDWLLAATLRASVLTVGVLLVQWLLRHHLSPRWRHALWLPVLIVLLTPVFPESPWSLGSTFPQDTPPQMVQLPPPVMTAALPQTHGGTTTMAPTPTGAGQPESLDWRRLCLLGWAAGAATVLLGGMLSFSRVLLRFKAARLPVNEKLQTLIAQTVREVGLRRAPEVWMSSRVSSPAVAGLLRPTLLLPAEFDRGFTLAEVRLILRHELTHLKRHDLPVNALMCVLIALHWFNPVLWLAFFKVRADRETACDAQVLHNATHAGRVEYGHALLKVESAFSPLSLSLGFVGIFQRGAALRSRIRAIAVQRRSSPLAGVVTTACILLMTFFGITRAQQPGGAAAHEQQQLIALEIKLVKFDKPTDWNFGGRLPQKANDHHLGLLLGPDELATTIQEVTRQEAAQITSYPRMVTENNREAHIRSVINQPYKTPDGQVAHMPIGLVWKVTPQIRDAAISLNVDLTDSHFIDPKTGAAIPSYKGEHPTVRTLTYKAPHSFPQGHSLVIAGWADGEPKSKRPALYVITPVVIGPKKGGLPEGISLIPDSKADAANAFVLGQSTFRPGDFIRINSMTRTAGLLTVTFDYELASAERALLSFSITSLSETEGRKTDPRQNMEVRRGKGSGTLHLPDPYPGIPHLTFYSAANQSAIGGIYFGTAVEATASKQLDLGYMLQDGDTTSAQTTSSTPPEATYAAAIHGKLQSIIVPKVQFNDATLQESVNFMRVKSRELDPAATAKGVPFVLLQNNLPAEARITLQLQDVPLREMLRYVTELAGVKYLVTPSEVVIGSAADLRTRVLAEVKNRTPLTTAAAARAVNAPGAAPAAQPPGAQLILPEVKLRGTRFDAALDFIQTKARGLDPAKKGVNILIRPGGKVDTPITLDLKDVPVAEAVRYVAELAGYKFTVEPYGILLQPQ